MKNLKLYQTTAAMNADLGNLETPYVALAEDALDTPVIGKYVKKLKVYISSAVYNKINTLHTAELFINGSSVTEGFNEGTYLFQAEIDGSDGTLRFDYCLEMNPGDSISISSEEDSYSIYSLTTFTEVSTFTEGGSGGEATLNSVQEDVYITYGGDSGIYN